MKPFTFTAALLAVIAATSGQMILAYPPALSIMDPLARDGSNFPCKGYQSDIGTASGSSVATFVTGGRYNFTIAGGATLNGGSCQASLSYDNGKSFTAIHSYIGGCPMVTPPGGSFYFGVPSDAPTGPALFAWTWFNEIGNRDMYMDCASVTIVSRGSGLRTQYTNVTFSSRPSIFVANLQNGCTTIEVTDVSFPEPGPDVTNVTVRPGGVIGTCEAIAGIGAFEGSSSLPLNSSLAGEPAANTVSSYLYTSTRLGTMSLLAELATQTAKMSSTSVSTSQSAAVSLSNSTTLLTMSTSTTTPPISSIETTASSSGYLFNSQSDQNIAVYFGQTPVTNGTSLKAQCANPNIDIVILAFVISPTYSGIYPEVNFGAACGGQTATMISEAPGLLYCPQLGADINTCQSSFGKKVLLSIGGSASQITFSSASQASTFGDMLWELFGPPGNIDINLRPFGNVSVDGFDIDNEDNQPDNYQVLGSTLRSHFSSYPSKSFFLSSAPQCPFPDASNPLDMLLLCDFVWVQFYNNPPCEIGSTGFIASVKQWSGALANSTMLPRLFLGAPAWPQAGSTAYSNIGTPQGMEAVAMTVEQLGLDNFGGVMFWDGPEGMLNVEGGKSIIAWAKAGLAE